MVNSNKKSPGANILVGSPPVSTGGSVPASTTAGNSSNPSGNAGSTGAPATPTPTPGAGTKAKRGLRTEITTVYNGIGSQLPDGSTLLVSGTPIPKQTLLTTFAAVLADYADIDAAAQALKSQRLALKAATPAARQLLASVKAALVALFGKGNPALVAFGYSGTKPRQLTSVQKVARKEKASQTRILRGTKGPRAIRDVKFQGQVQVQTSVSGTPTQGGNAPATSSNTAGAVSTPTVSGTPAPAPGNTGSSTP
jgi:hypothetical protein